MDPEKISFLAFILFLSIFLGFEVISKVPSILHTPLMSGTNAICGIILVGSILALGSGKTWLPILLGVIAVISATINVVGGFFITDRMLKMFKSKSEKRKKI